MCFRPADITGGGGINKCPDCGRSIQNLGGVLEKSCPFCGADFTDYLNGTKPVPGATAPGAPGAPAAPGAPKAPGAPAAPGAPKAPGA